MMILEDISLLKNSKMKYNKYRVTMEDILNLNIESDMHDLYLHFVCYDGFRSRLQFSNVYNIV